MLTRYIAAAMPLAHFGLLEEGGYFGSIPGLHGAWGSGLTLKNLPRGVSGGAGGKRVGLNCALLRFPFVPREAPFFSSAFCPNSYSSATTGKPSMPPKSLSRLTSVAPSTSAVAAIHRSFSSSVRPRCWRVSLTAA